MKPSERIGEILRELRPPSPPTWQEWNRDVLLAFEAMARYLNEQAEIEQRRTCVRNALAMVSQHASLKQLNEQLEKGGLECRVELGDSCDEAHRRIVDAAKREGLF